jgi:outer membrane protein TolC
MRFLRTLPLLAAACALPAFAWAADPVAPPRPASVSMHALVEAAWQRSPQARGLAGRQDEAAAERALADTWLAAPPTLGISDRSDRWTERQNQRESELSIGAPVLLPGQRKARQALAAERGSEVQAQLAQSRLVLAGEVRTRLWDAAAAAALLAEKQDHLHHLEELAEDVQRRVKAGDLARTDGLLAQQEVLTAKAEVAHARTRARETLLRLRVLTGIAHLPDLPPEPLPGEQAPGAEHVRLRAVHATEARARAALDLAKASVQGPPTVVLSMRREREGLVPASDRSIGVAVQVPLGGRQRNRPAEALAASQWGVASAERAQAQSEIEAEAELAREQLDNARQALDAANSRALALREHTTLIEKAFRLGERPLAELLRARALAHEAEMSLRKQQVAVARAHAQVNQALGIIP